MYDTTMIDSWQAHLPVQYASNIELIRQKWHWFCVWQLVTVFDSRTFKTSLLFVPFVVHVHADCSALTPTKQLIRFHIKYKIVLFP